jgi:hypothetical protein
MLKVTIEVPYEPVTGIIPSLPKVTRGGFVALTQQQSF